MGDLIASESVERIVALYPGCLYRRLLEKNGDNNRMSYGRVLSIMDNGDKKVISAMELHEPYYSGSPDLKLVTLTSDQTIDLYPLPLEDMAAVIEDWTESAASAVRSRQYELRKALRVQNEIKRLSDDLDNQSVPEAMIAREPR